MDWASIASAASGGAGSILNYRAQLKKLNYDKTVQNIAWRREDSSIQRRVNDLRAAGLSPVLAAGQGASSGPIVTTQAPQLNFDPVQTVLNAIQQQANISQTYAQTKLADAQKEQSLANARLADANAATVGYDLGKSKDVGTSTKPSIVGSIIRDLFGITTDSNASRGVQQQLKNKQENDNKTNQNILQKQKLDDKRYRNNDNYDINYKPLQGPSRQGKSGSW